MAPVAVETAVQIPPGIVDRAAFRRWLHSADFPDKGRIGYLLGGVFVDMSKGQLFSHSQVKQEYNLVVGGHVKTSKLGRWFPDGVLLGSAEADFTCGPDGCFVSREALETGRVRLISGSREGFLELEGAVDMVLEVVSDSSVQKDTVLMPDLYWEAGVLEYWLVDARGERLSFDIFRHGAKGYTPIKRQAGWVKSMVFGKAFRLLRTKDDQDHPEFTLEMK